MPSLLVSDIFKSIQGEGPRLGAPSIFLRLGVCNLHCKWCDTPYTWKEGQRDFRSMKVEMVLRQIIKLKQRTNIRNLVITGGEPLLQQANLAPLLAGIFSRKQFADFGVEFETNGSMELLPEFKKIIKNRPIFFNISPKLADSGNKPYKINIYPHSALKFVYTSPKSEKLIDAFLKSCGKKAPAVYIMPEGTTVKKMQKKYQNLLDYCAKRGYKFSPRLHIYLFGNRRGT